MADFVFNIAKGRVVEYCQRVDSNDPANSALIIVVLATSGLESDATLKDKTSARSSGRRQRLTKPNW